MTKIALILSGGASLGSYVGGAVTEILYALETGETREPVTVDVVAGASAGALNAALAARSLLVNPNLRPWIERAWVEAVDAGVLLAPDRTPSGGLLDAGALDELTSALVAGGPAADDRTSRLAGLPLRVGISLSNLDGIPYRLRYGFLNVRERFYGTRIYRDWAEFELGPEQGAGAPVWDRLRRTAVASASFPFALPPRRLVRDRADYPGARLEDVDGEVEMWYTDGGLFENEPLGLAKRLVERDPEHRSHDWKYVLVDPYMEDTGAAERGAPGDPTTPARMAERLARAVLGQGAARDWIRANRVNARLEILDRIVERLPELASRMDDPEAVGLGREIGQLAEDVAEMKVAVRRGPADESGDPVVDYLEANLSRIQSEARYAGAFEESDSRAGRTRVAKLIFVLEAAAGLREKDPMDLFLIAPPEGERLAGAFLGNFGGFFDPRWRAQDFRAGRRDARRLLTGELRPLVDYEPTGEEAYRVQGLSPGFEDLSPRARARLERFLGAEVDRLLDDVEPGFVASLFRWAWHPVVRRWAVDRALARLRELH